MTPIRKRRAFLPACLALGALLGALPVLADAPAAPSAGAVQAQSIPLMHVVPDTVLKALHWDQTAQRFDSTAPVRIEGVTQINGQPATNSLSVVATPAGLAQLQQIVKILDVASRQVQVKFALAHATNAGLKASGAPFESVLPPSLLTAPMPAIKYATGKEVALFLQSLMPQGAVTQAPILTTSNNVDASISISTASQSAASAVTFAATPRVNSDGSITLALHSSVPDGAEPWQIKTRRTVKNGETMVFSRVSSARRVDGENLLLFVTPTILSTDKGAAAVTVK